MRVAGSSPARSTAARMATPPSSVAGTVLRRATELADRRARRADDEDLAVGLLVGGHARILAEDLLGHVCELIRDLGCIGLGEDDRGHGSQRSAGRVGRIESIDAEEVDVNVPTSHDRVGVRADLPIRPARIRSVS